MKKVKELLKKQTTIKFKMKLNYLFLNVQMPVLLQVLNNQSIVVVHCTCVMFQVVGNDHHTLADLFWAIGTSDEEKSV